MPRLTALSNVVHGLLAFSPGPRNSIQSLASADSRKRALAALDRVGLADFALRRVDSLSGGQSQRVAIARALVPEPRLVLADEPAASLDPAAGEEVMDVFARVVRDTGATLVFTTHNSRSCACRWPRVLGLREGRLALDAGTQTLASRGTSWPLRLNAPVTWGCRLIRTSVIPAVPFYALVLGVLVWSLDGTGWSFSELATGLPALADFFAAYMAAKPGAAPFAVFRACRDVSDGHRRYRGRRAHFGSPGGVLGQGPLGNRWSTSWHVASWRFSGPFRISSGH